MIIYERHIRLYEGLHNTDLVERYNRSISIYALDNAINIIRTKEIMRDINEEMIAEQDKKCKCVDTSQFPIFIIRNGSIN